MTARFPGKEKGIFFIINRVGESRARGRIQVGRISKGCEEWKMSSMQGCGRVLLGSGCARLYPSLGETDFLCSLAEDSEQ